MLVIGIAGAELNAQERQWLQHPGCGGVILFSRNFSSRTQAAELSAAIREAAPHPQLLCVDQEGGRVQRFQDGYSPLPPMQAFDAMFRIDPEQASVGLRPRRATISNSIQAVRLIKPD